MSAGDEVQRLLREHARVLELVADTMTEDILRLAACVTDAFRSGGKVLFCGNGGSAADAQHLAAEYVVRFARERRALPALALTTDSSILTAAGNDWGFDTIFERQVRGLGRPGDLLIVHSTSGESENLVCAIRAAREGGVATAALLARGGGRLKDMVDLAFVVPTQSTALAQEMHLTIGHIVCGLVESALAEE